MKESFISSSRICDAMRYFEQHNFRHLDVPMVIPKDINDVTCPHDAEVIYHGEEVYNGSAEQGFLCLIDQGFIRSGKYMALTPCTRSDELDDTHFRIFVKLELINILEHGLTVDDKYAQSQLGDMVEQSMNFIFRQTARCKNPGRVRAMVVEHTKTNLQYDITVNDIEIGSYGLRHASNGLLYVYGTGIAEPRFSYALSRS